MKLIKICVFFFVLFFSLGCGKSNDPDDELLILGSGGCGIGKGSLVTMADGSTKKIEMLVKGDSVFSDNGSAKAITDVISGTKEMIFLINTTSRKSIIIGEGHPVRTPDGWITVGDINVGKVIDGKNGNETVSQISMQSYNDKIYILKFNEETAFVANGFIVGDYAIYQRLVSR